MLKHEDNPETPSQSAAQVRVTPEELAAAITRLEARQGGLDGTIPLGDAVQELGLSATPEELLREIEAGRVRPQENHSQRSMPKANRVGVGAVFGLALLLSGGMTAFLRTSAPSPPIADLPAISTVSVPQSAPQPISLAPNLIVQDASGKLVMLSEVGDGQPVKCFFSDTTPPHFLPFTLDNNPAGAWTLIKHEGKVYVRGWIPRISTKALTTVGTDVSGDVSYTRSQSPVPVTLAVDGFQVPAGTGDENVFRAVSIRLDKHANEKWQP